MLKRLALVFWWLGALAGAGFLIAPPIALVVDGLRTAGTAIAVAATAGVLTVGAFWALAFVLGGSFWRPPRPPQV